MATTATPDPRANAVTADDERLASLGYAPQLNRVLGLFANFSVAFTYLSPMVGIYSLFVLGVGTGGPVYLWLTILPVVGMLVRHHELEGGHHVTRFEPVNRVQLLGPAPGARLQIHAKRSGRSFVRRRHDLPWPSYLPQLAAQPCPHSSRMHEPHTVVAGNQCGCQASSD